MICKPIPRETKAAVGCCVSFRHRGTLECVRALASLWKQGPD
jgi:hypothetical protein